MDEVLSLSTARQRFNMLLMTVFGAMALLLAAIGIYGLMAYSVAQRTQEIGIRLALGAEGSQVRNMVVKQGMGLALAGVVDRACGGVGAGAIDRELLVRGEGSRSAGVRRGSVGAGAGGATRGVASGESSREGEPGRIAALRIDRARENTPPPDA